MQKLIKLTQVSGSKEDEKVIYVNVSHIKWMKNNSPKSKNKSLIGIDFIDIKAITVKESPEEIMSLIYGDISDKNNKVKSNIASLSNFP